MDYMSIVRIIIRFILIYITIYLFYFFSVVNPQIKFMSGKTKKEKKGKKNEKKDKKEKDKKEHNDLLLLKNYYKVDIEKIGVVRVLRILNAVNAFVLTILVMIVLPLKQNWLKMVILAVLMLPTIWVTYYFIAKYLKHIERKDD